MIWLHQSKGQAVLESLVAAAALMAFTGLLLALIYFCVLKTYLQCSSHELLVCRELASPWTCEKKFKAEFEAVLRFGQIETLWCRKDPHRQLLHLRLKFLFFKKVIRWTYEDQISLPLKAT